MENCEEFLHNVKINCKEFLHIYKPPKKIFNIADKFVKIQCNFAKF